MNLVYMCNEYPPGRHGGVGTFTRTLARAMAGRGHRVTVLGIYPPGQAGVTTDQGVRVVRLPHTRAPGLGFFAHGRALREALRGLQHLVRRARVAAYNSHGLSA